MKHFPLPVVLAATSILLAAAGPVRAQDSSQSGQSGSGSAGGGTGSTSSYQQSGRDDDRGPNWSWIGLLGLAGLAGLRRPAQVVNRPAAEGNSRAF